MNEVVSDSSNGLPFADRLLDTVTALVVATVEQQASSGGGLLNAHWAGDKGRVAELLAVVMDTAVTIHRAAGRDGRELLAERNERMQAMAGRAERKPDLWARFSCLGVPEDVRKHLEYRCEQPDANALQALRQADLKYLGYRSTIYWDVANADGRDVTINLTGLRTEGE